MFIRLTNAQDGNTLLINTRFIRYMVDCNPSNEQWSRLKNLCAWKEYPATRIFLADQDPAMVHDVKESIHHIELQIEGRMKNAQQV